MKIKSNLLSFFHDGSDKSKEINPFGIEYSMTLTSTGHLDIGFTKPINQIFVEIKTANTNNSTISIQKHNGTTWVNTECLDQTNGFKKSGFIFFNEDDQATKLNHNGIDQYWLRLKVSANTSAVLLNGINLVFCNLDDLRMEEPSIEKFYPREISSHIFSMVAARDYILRRINNSQPYAYYLLSINALAAQRYVDVRNFNQFDIFDVNEIRDAAVFYTLHKIFSNRSDEQNDVYKQKADDYLAKFESSFKLWQGRKLTIDIDNDGGETATDKNASIRTISITR